MRFFCDMMRLTLVASLIVAPVGSLSPGAIRAEAHFTRVISNAQRSVTRDTSEMLELTPGYIAGTLAFNMGAHIVIAREMAELVELPALTLFNAGLISNLHGLAWGVPAALVVAAIEVWRCDECSVAEAAAYECPRCSALTNPVLIGTAPLALLSALLLNDHSIGERAVAILSSTAGPESAVRSFDGAPRGLPSSTSVVAAGGALVSSIWAQGLAQSAVCAWFHEATTRVAIAGMVDAEVAMAPLICALVGMRTALEPAAVILLTTALVTVVESAVTRSLQPVATATERETAAALAQARQRARSLFVLDITPVEEAERAACAFDEHIYKWERRRQELTRRDQTASAARALVAAAAFAASGGCLLAPVVAGLGVVASFDDVPYVPFLSPVEEDDAPPPLKPVLGFVVFATAWACRWSSLAAVADAGSM